MGSKSCLRGWGLRKRGTWRAPLRFLLSAALLGRGNFLPAVDISRDLTQGPLSAGVRVRIHNVDDGPHLRGGEPEADRVRVVFRLKRRAEPEAWSGADDSHSESSFPLPADQEDGSLSYR